MMRLHDGPVRGQGVRWGAAERMGQSTGHRGLSVGLGTQAHLWVTREGLAMREGSSVTSQPGTRGDGAWS